MVFRIALIIALATPRMAFAAGGARPPAAAEFQAKIVQLFSADRCDLVRRSVSPEMYARLRPNVRAIVAFCLSDGEEAERLFVAAEREDPSGDLILLLHAKRTWIRDPERARPLWDKVLQLSRNGAFRVMARRYLADEVEEDEPMSLSPLTWEGYARVGGGFDSNPLLPLAPQSSTHHPQAFTSAAFHTSVQRWVPIGSVSGIYEGEYRRYLATPSLSFFENQLGVPVNFRVGTAEDVGLRPFYGLSLAGGRQYGQRFGLAIRGVAYRTDYRQSVEGSVFQERLYFPSVVPEEGTHYRFDYQWDFFPGQWIYQFHATVDHVRAINDFNNGTNLRFSHTDVATSFQAQYLARGFTYECMLNARMRFDDLASSYKLTTTGGTIGNRRNDLTLGIEPAVHTPLTKEISVRAVYGFVHTFSPIGHNPGDYADYNITDHRGELQLVAEFSNY